MAVSDEVASLKVSVHKLAVAIEELTIKRYIKGEIDKSKLPWFTPQYVPGDSIKASGNRVPTAAACLDNNEVISSSTSSFLNVSNTLLGAHQVFEKMPEPISSSNNDQVAVIGDHRLLNDIDEVQPSGNGVGEPYVDGIMPDYVRTAHKLFHTMPVPDFILEMANVAKITHENEEITDAHQVFDIIPEPISLLNQAQENEDVAYAHQVFDTIHEPTEQDSMSQTVCQAVVTTNEDTSVNNVHFTHKQQLFETLDALTASYSHDMVGIKANRKHILMLQGLISPNCGAFDQTPNKYGEFYNGNSYYLECPYLQVTIKPSPSFVEIGSRVLYKGAMNIYYDDLVWNKISEPICLCRFVFYPGVLLKGVSNFENFPHSKLLELKIELRANLHCKEVHSWEKLEVILDVLIGLDNLVNTFQPSSFHNFVNFLLYSAINNHAHTRTLNSCGNSSENADLMIVHYMDLKPGVLNTIYLFHGIELLSFRTCSVLSHDLGDYNMSTSRMSDKYRLFDPGILVHDTSVSFFTYTLEDKVDFRGEENTNEECIWESLHHPDMRSKYNASRVNISILPISYVFDPGGFSCCVGQISMIMLNGFWGEEDKVCSLEVFDPGGECLCMICECLNYVFTGSLNRLSSKLDEGIRAHFKVFDLGDHACIGSDNKLSFQMKNYDLNGIKMIKITRLGQSCLDISSLNLIQYGKSLLSHQSTYMNLEFIYESLSHLVGSQLGSITYGVASGNHEVGYYEALIALYATRDMKSFKGPKHSLVSFSFMSHIAPLNAAEVKVTFVFDPGGYESGLKMRIRPRFCGGKGITDESYKNHQVYVFDPGGSLSKQATNDVRTSEKCYAIALLHMEYGVYYLSLILEDKDHFKRRVLIRTKLL